MKHLDWLLTEIETKNNCHDQPIRIIKKMNWGFYGNTLIVYFLFELNVF